jgi:hypothetical protein
MVPSTNVTAGAAMSDATMRGRSKAIAATTIGNVLEWYDFAVYGDLVVR